MYLRHDTYFLSNYSPNPYWYFCRILTGEEIPISPFSPLVQEVDDEGTERRQALSYPQLTKLVWTVLELVETLSHYRCCRHRLWELFVQFTIKHSRKIM